MLIKLNVDEVAKRLFNDAVNMDKTKQAISFALYSSLKEGNFVTLEMFLEVAEISENYAQ